MFTVKRKEDSEGEGKNTQGDLADASPREHPFHGDYCWRQRRRCAFLREHGAFLSSQVRFLERLAKERHFSCVHRHAQYFITSLFTWSQTRSTAAPAGYTASCWWTGICGLQLKTQKEYQTVQVFLEVAQLQKKHGNLWPFGGAREMPRRPRT